MESVLKLAIPTYIPVILSPSLDLAANAQFPAFYRYKSYCYKRYAIKVTATNVVIMNVAAIHAIDSTRS